VQWEAEMKGLRVALTEKERQVCIAHAKEPYISAKKPCISAKEPCVSTISAKELCLSTKPPWREALGV